MKFPGLFCIAGMMLAFGSCQKSASSTENSSTAKLIFTFKFDSTQARLSNIGQPVGIAAGHAAQSPVMRKMSSHYVELTPNALTALGAGAVLYKAPETTAGGENAIDFEKSTLVGNGETFFTMPLSQIPAGTYEWLRISLAYQNGDVKFWVDTTINGVSFKQEQTGTLAGFIGFNSYIKTFNVKDQPVVVNANRKQGFWAFETNIVYNNINVPYVTSGQSPAGATTVVNPLFATSPVPQGSCVVTASIPNKLVITGKETKDITLEVSLSTNKSFEWEDLNGDGKWQPGKGERTTDMGIRGMVVNVK